MLKKIRIGELKKWGIISLLGCFVFTGSFGQNVGIGTNLPVTNLHVQGGANAGLLVQNINGLGQAQIEVQSSTTSNQSLRFVHFNNNSGGTFAGIPLSGVSVISTGINNGAGLILGTANNAPLFLITNNTRRLTLLESGAMAIGAANPTASAQLDIQGTTGGLLLPRLTTTQRNALVSPANGLLVYNTTTNVFNYYKTGTGWVEVGAGGSATGDAWLTSGNATAPPGAMLGTFNQEPLRFRVLGQPSGMFWYDAEANTFAGFASGVLNQTGNNNNRANTGFGTSTLTGLTTGEQNTAVGSEAGFSMTAGTRNIYLGRQAGYRHNTQSGNVAIGASALYHIKGDDHIAIGDSAYYGAASGTASLSNIAIGKNSLKAATTAAGNISIGRLVLQNAQTGSQNVAIGDQAMQYTTNAGSQNVGIGTSALAYNTGTYNTSVGAYAGSKVKGSKNVSLGGWAMQDHETGNSNIAIGFAAMRSVANSFNLVAVGDSALFAYSGTVGGNTAVGSKAGAALTSGAQNTILGFEALADGQFTNGNVAIGYHALNGLQGGGDNVAIGHSANVKNNIGAGATAIGAEASAGANNSTAIGYQANITGPNKMGFGNTAVTSWVFGRTTNTANRALEVGTNNTNGNGAFLTTGGTWTNNSDVNLKEEITTISTHDILQKIANMPITRWKYKGTNEFHIGPMAQDFHAAFKTGTDNKSISSIDPAGVALAAIQALIEQNEKLTQEIISLKKKMGF